MKHHAKQLEIASWFLAGIAISAFFNQLGIYWPSSLKLVAIFHLVAIPLTAFLIHKESTRVKGVLMASALLVGLVIACI